jgi:hypothetical protein
MKYRGDRVVFISSITKIPLMLVEFLWGQETDEMIDTLAKLIMRYEGKLDSAAQARPPLMNIQFSIPLQH